MSAPFFAGQSDGSIWQRIIRPERDDLTRPGAEALLKLHFDDADLARMHELAQKDQDGDASDQERDELQIYRRVGLQLDLFHSKARLTLKRLSSAG